MYTNPKIKNISNFLPLLLLGLYLAACGTTQNSSSASSSEPSNQQVSYDTVYVQRDAFNDTELSETEKLKRKIFGTEANTPYVDETPLDVEPEIIGEPQDILNKVEYPPVLRSKGVSGKSVAEFVISPEGTVTNIKILESLHPMLDKEIINALSTAKFKPGMINDEAVPTLVEMPFTFNVR